MKCPLCKNKAKEAMYRPGKYVCRCTGVLEDIDVLEKQNITNKVTEIKKEVNPGGQALKYYGKQRIVISKDRNASSSGKIKLNFGLGLDLKTGSHILGKELMPNIKRGSISLCIDKEGSNDASYILAKSLCNVKNQKILVIDPLGTFSKKMNNQIKTFKNDNILDNVFDEIEREQKQYDGIIVLDTNFLITQRCMDDGKISSPRIEKEISDRIALLNSIKAATIVFFSSGVTKGMYANITCPKRLNAIAQVSEVILRSRVPRTVGRDSRLECVIVKNIYKTNKDLKIDIPLKNEEIDKTLDIIETAKSKNLLELIGRSWYYRGMYSLKDNSGNKFNHGDKIASKRAELTEIIDISENKDTLEKEL